MSRPQRARKVKSIPVSEPDPDPEDIYKEPRFEACLQDDEMWKMWMIDAWRAVQQVCCRIVGKEWIKLIHPKKQSTHPYNGKNPRTGEQGDSEDTKPPYWPSNVRHREPDHINKDGKSNILYFLVCVF